MPAPVLAALRQPDMLGHGASRRLVVSDIDPKPLPLDASECSPTHHRPIGRSSEQLSYAMQSGHDELGDAVWSAAPASRGLRLVVSVVGSFAHQAVLEVCDAGRLDGAHLLQP